LDPRNIGRDRAPENRQMLINTFGIIGLRLQCEKVLSVDMCMSIDAHEMWKT
jgi:hypothetical protein